MFVGTGIFDYGFTATNGTYTQPYSAVLIDMLDKRKIYLVGLGCWPFTPPAGDMVYHIRGDGPTWPDIYRMNLADLLTRSSYEAEVAHPDADWGHEYHPQVSNDNQWMVYMASQGCHWDWNCNNEIFIHKIGTDSTSRTQVTYDDSFDAFPSIFVGTPCTATAPPRLVLSPDKITFFARTAAVPGPRTILAKSSAADSPGVTDVTVKTSASWFDAAVDGNKITVSVRAGQVWRGRCKGTVSVTVPGLEGSPGLIQVILDADDTFPVAPIQSVALDAGAVNEQGAMDAGEGIDAMVSSLDGGLLSIDSTSDLALDAPPCDADIPPQISTFDASASPDVTASPTGKAQGSGCGCSLGQPPSRASALLLFLLAFLIRRPRRAATRVASVQPKR
jgi:MYXO-CTERM domain-containing protein